MNLRTADKGDEEAIFELLVRMHAEVGLAPMDEHKVRARIRHVLTNGKAFLAENDAGEVVGSIGCVPDSFWYSSAVELFDAWIYVAPEGRGSTAASRLIKAYKAEAARRGFRQPYLGRMNVIDAERKDHLFQHHGFSPIGSLFRLKEDAHVLR